jgi:hypothetical protein
MLLPSLFGCSFVEAAGEARGGPKKNTKKAKTNKNNVKKTFDNMLNEEGTSHPPKKL